MPLSKCPGGRIVRLDVPGDEGRRLAELGAVPGTEVRVTRRAPLGDPIQIVVRGYALTLRKSAADAIFVEARERGKGSK